MAVYAAQVSAAGVGTGELCGDVLTGVSAATDALALVRNQGRFYIESLSGRGRGRAIRVNDDLGANSCPEEEKGAIPLLEVPTHGVGQAVRRSSRTVWLGGAWVSSCAEGEGA